MSLFSQTEGTGILSFPLEKLSPMTVYIDGLGEESEIPMMSACHQLGYDAVVIGGIGESSGSLRVRFGTDVCLVRDLAAVSPLIRMADLVVVSDPLGMVQVENATRAEYRDCSFSYLGEECEVSELVARVTSDLKQKSLARPPVGLILAGGKSRRMGEDKALLSYGSGLNQIESLVDTLSGYCSEVVVSSPADRKEAYLRSRAAHFLPDSFQDLGPLGGILSAQRAFPEETLFVLAIDLPGLKQETLDYLVGSRNPFRFGTAFSSVRNDGVEPLCALYEPKSYGAFLEALSFDRRCPAKILSSLPVQRLEQRPGIDDLRNINTPSERASFVAEGGQA